MSQMWLCIIFIVLSPPPPPLAETFPSSQQVSFYFHVLFVCDSLSSGLRHGWEIIGWIVGKFSKWLCHWRKWYLLSWQSLTVKSSWLRGSISMMEWVLLGSVLCRSSQITTASVRSGVQRPGMSTCLFLQNASSSPGSYILSVMFPEPWHRWNRMGHFTEKAISSK